jgi:non-lysosomal glucosylceramidase
MKQKSSGINSYRSKLPVYTEKHTEAAYLLGGIGTGNVSVGSRGEFRDWEIFNCSGKNNMIPYTFFAIRVQDEKGKVDTRILESELQPPFTKSHGFTSEEVAGLPRFKRSEMRGGQPFVTVDLIDDVLPVEVVMEAFTPFIPLNAKDSGLPVFRVCYEVRNPSDSPVNVSVAGSLSNAVGFGLESDDGHLINKTIKIGDLQGVEYTREDLPAESTVNGSMFLGTPDMTATIKPRWLIGGWYDAIHDFWDDFVSDGKLDTESCFDAPGNDLYHQHTAPGSVCLSKSISPGEKHVFVFFVSWYFSYRTGGWENQSCKITDGNCETSDLVKNYYTNHFSGAGEVAAYIYEKEQVLEESSRSFERILWESSLPTVVLDAISANCTVIRSNTCFRLADGTLYGWEGCNDDSGCCPGT